MVTIIEAEPENKQDEYGERVSESEGWKQEQED